MAKSKKPTQVKAAETTQKVVEAEPLRIPREELMKQPGWSNTAGKAIAPRKVSTRAY